MTDNFKTMVIINPNSANGNTGRQWPQIREHIRSVLPEFSAEMTSAPGDATDIHIVPHLACVRPDTETPGQYPTLVLTKDRAFDKKPVLHRWSEGGTSGTVPYPGGAIRTPRQNPGLVSAENSPID